MKKVLSLLIVLSMIVSTLPLVEAHWADEDVKYLIENGAIAEDDAMLENLDTPITRSQMVKVIVALLEGEEPEEGKEYFTDITLDDTHIAKAAANGFVNGFGDGTFRPNNPITRQDFFTIVGRAYKLEGEATSEFTDNDAIADYAKPYVDALQSIGIVNGYGDGTVNPRGNITIAETLAVMRRTDEHVKANAPEEPPKEEEKPKPMPSGGGGGGSFSGPMIVPIQPSATLTVEYAEDFSNGYVAYVTPEITTYDSCRLETKFLAAGAFEDYINTTSSGSPSPYYIASYATDSYIPEKDGKFAVPDFGTYTLFMRDECDTWGHAEVTVLQPESEDKEFPQITLTAPQKYEQPMTVQIDVADNEGVARIDYVKFTGLILTNSERSYRGDIENRQSITGDSFTIKSYGTYIVCAMDTSGNCSYATIEAPNNGQVTITYSTGVPVKADMFAPTIEYTLSTEEECNGALTITTDIRDKDGFAEYGWFFMREYNNLNGVEQVKTAYMLRNSEIDLSKDIVDLVAIDDQHGGAGSICILKNYHTAVDKKSIENKTITATENGAYFIYAKDTKGNITVVRAYIDNIKTASATFEVAHEEDTSSENVAHVTATVEANPNAPVKQMFAVKSDYEPESAGTYRAYTPNGKAQKIWDEVSVSGEYIPVEGSKFSVSEYGTYSLYMLDEYGNWGVSEVTIEEPELEPEPEPEPEPQPEPDSTEP